MSVLAATAARLLLAVTGALLIATGIDLPVVGFLVDVEVWRTIFQVAGGGLLLAGLSPNLDPVARAALAALVVVALWGRALSLLIAILHGNASDTPAIGALVWPLLSAYIVYILGIWPPRHLASAPPP